MACFLGACSTTGGIDTSYTAQSQDSRIQFIVLHCTTSDFDRSLATLTKGEVSAHYLVRDNPVKVYRLVDDNRRAYHAGDSSWQGNTQLNAASIGIEIVNLGYQDGLWFEYPPAQVDAVIRLVKRLVDEYHVRPDRIVGHSDIAPQRKIDPGPRFPWKRLADVGLVDWPDAQAVASRRARYEAQLPDIAWFQAMLARVGYAIERTEQADAQTRNVLAAFQMHYRPERFDGVADAESAAILDVLTSSR